MTEAIVSRRAVLKAGPCALVATSGMPTLAGVRGASGLSPESEETIRKWYAAWEKKDWAPVDALLADDFTFTSAAGDDHINKSAFKTQCWQTQIDFIDRFELQHVIGSRREAFVMYVCRTKNGNLFRNVEYLRLKGEKLESIECYFGAQSSFASAVGSGKS